MERDYWRESACATKSGSRARYQHTFQRKRIQNGLSNAAYAVEFQESGPNFRHAEKGQTIPLLDLVAGRPVVESIAQRNGRLARLPSGSTLDQWKWLPLSELTRILYSKGSMRFCCISLQVIGYPTYSWIRRRRLEPVPNIKVIKSSWEKPKETISVSLKTKARRNELWSPLSLTELANFGEA